MTTKVYPLSDSTAVVVIENALSISDVAYFTSTLHKAKTQYGRRIFGHLPPRRQVVMTWTGDNWATGKNNTAQAYTTRDIDVAYKLRHSLDKAFSWIPYWTLDNSNEVEYDASYKRGGSIGAHRDDELPWKLVTCFSYGQTRFMEFGNHETTKTTLKVALPSNSLLAMVGEDFQVLHWHKLPKLRASVEPKFRVSFNSRWF